MGSRIYGDLYQFTLPQRIPSFYLSLSLSSMDHLFNSHLVVEDGMDLDRVSYVSLDPDPALPIKLLLSLVY